MDRGSLPLGSYFVYDLSLPSIIFPRSDNPLYVLTHSRRVLLEGDCAVLGERAKEKEKESERERETT